jgi:hypothetical protein
MRQQRRPQFQRQSASQAPLSGEAPVPVPPAKRVSGLIERRPEWNPLTVHVNALERVAEGIKTVAQDMCGSNHLALREHWEELQRIIRLARDGRR